MYLGTVKLGSNVDTSAAQVPQDYPYNATFLALCLSAFTMCTICLVITPLGPSHNGEALLNRIRMQGQHDFEEPAELRYRECWCFFPPNVPSSAREKNGRAS